MKIFIAILLLTLSLTQVYGQSQRKLSTYFLTQYTKTIDDVTKGNNPWGMGLGLQTFLNNKTKFKPTIELTGDIYLEDDKVFRADSTGTGFKDVRGMTNIFIKSSFNPTKNSYVSFVAGPSFFAAKPYSA